jgi:hypothetical protein
MHARAGRKRVILDVSFYTESEIAFYSIIGLYVVGCRFWERWYLREWRPLFTGSLETN